MPDPTRSELARQLAQHPRRRHEVVCGVCGVVFSGGPKARYCSGACKVKAWRSAHVKPSPPPPAGEPPGRVKRRPK